MRKLEENQLYIALDHDDGSVWTAQHGGEPVREFADTASALTSDRLLQAPAIRMLGTQANAPFLCDLYLRSKPGCRLEVSSTRIHGATYHEPAKVLESARRCFWPAAVGGWHVFRGVDHATYSLVGLDGDELVAGVLAHDIWPRLSFVGTTSPLHVGKILQYILDPRWFVDLANPSRLSRLRSYMGVGPRSDLVLARGNRFAALSAAWSGCDEAPSDVYLPRNFLWQQLTDEPPSRDWKTAKTYLCFLVRSWQEVIAGNTGEFFIPELLLSPEVAKAFRDYLKDLSSTG